MTKTDNKTAATGDKGKRKKRPDVTIFKKLCEENGFALVPMKGKEPFEVGWPKKGRKKVKFKPSEFEGKNAGVVCGSPSGVLVLDVDDLSSFVALQKAHGLKLPKTFKVKTGRDLPHRYYKIPKEGKK